MCVRSFVHVRIGERACACVRKRYTPTKVRRIKLVINIHIILIKVKVDYFYIVELATSSASTVLFGVLDESYFDGGHRRHKQ